MVVKKFNTAAVCHIWFVRTTQRRPIHGALYKFRHYRLIVTYLRILFFCHGLKVLFMGPKFHFGVWLLNVRIHRSDHPIAAPCAKWRIWALVDGWKLGKNVKIEELWRPLAPKPYTSYKKLIGSPQVLDYNVEWTVSFEGTSIRMSWPNLVKIRCWEQSKLIDLVGLYSLRYKNPRDSFEPQIFSHLADHAQNFLNVVPLDLYTKFGPDRLGFAGAGVILERLIFRLPKWLQCIGYCTVIQNLLNVIVVPDLCRFDARGRGHIVT